ncbi:NADH dehydrogenase subunit G domain protein, partial [Aeromicrobium marinum DSM 15272]
GGRLSLEDAHAYGVFARVALGTDDIDFRSRAHSDEETAFLAARVAGTGLGVTYVDLERAGTVVLAGLEPEDEAGTIFLRLRKAVQQRGLRVVAVGSHLTRGLDKLGATLVAAVPGHEAAVLSGQDIADLGLTAADVVLVGERLALAPGALTAAAGLADGTGARLAWVPRRAGDRG